MKLSEALQLAGQPVDASLPAKTLVLACGFTPCIWKRSFWRMARGTPAGRNLSIVTGLYGDLAGNLQKAGAAPLDYSAVVLEWADLDPRLGLRSAGGWMPESLPSIVESVSLALERIEPLLHDLAARAPLALAPPSLPLPPLAHTAGWQASDLSMALDARLGAFLERAVQIPGVRLLSRQRLDEASPPSARLDPKMELGAGFPFTPRQETHVKKSRFTEGQIIAAIKESGNAKRLCTFREVHPVAG